MTADRLAGPEARSPRPGGSPRGGWLRAVVATGLVGLIGLVPLWLAPAASAAPAADPSAGGWVDTKWGPLGPADKDLLAGVRRAGLWETPAGQMAVEKGGSARVKEVGKAISEQHVQLDGIVRREADKLGHPLPNQPNEDQQRWLAEMEQASPGAEFDRVFVDRLRQAHGKVYALIASVRAGTRNSIMREFAQTCESYVNTNMTLLESTGLVDYNTLPTANAVAAAKPAAGAAAPRAGADGPLVRPASSAAGGLSPMVIWLVLGAAAIAGAFTMLRVVRGR